MPSSYNFSCLFVWLFLFVVFHHNLFRISFVFVINDGRNTVARFGVKELDLFSQNWTFFMRFQTKLRMEDGRKGIRENWRRGQ
jgi:hypothetical protein